MPSVLSWSHLRTQLPWLRRKNVSIFPWNLFVSVEEHTLQAGKRWNSEKLAKRLEDAANIIKSVYRYEL